MTTVVAPARRGRAGACRRRCRRPSRRARATIRPRGAKLVVVNVQLILGGELGSAPRRHRRRRRARGRRAGGCGRSCSPVVAAGQLPRIPTFQPTSTRSSRAVTWSTVTISTRPDDPVGVERDPVVRRAACRAAATSAAPGAASAPVEPCANGLTACGAGSTRSRFSLRVGLDLLERLERLRLLVLAGDALHAEPRRHVQRLAVLDGEREPGERGDARAQAVVDQPREPDDRLAPRRRCGGTPRSRSAPGRRRGRRRPRPRGRRS